jgi:uncharacterized protein (DUF4415 family)
LPHISNFPDTYRGDNKSHDTAAGAVSLNCIKSNQRKVRTVAPPPKWEELQMNKEYEPEWDQPAVRNEDNTPTKAHAVAGVKQIVTIRLDVDMLEWFKSAGPGYQTRINQVLREYMEANRVRAQGEQH